MVIGPGRILIKEGDTPMMVYFLLTGEVEASQKVYNHVSKECAKFYTFLSVFHQTKKLNQNDILIRFRILGLVK